MKKYLISLALALASVVLGQDLTQEIYWNAQPPAVRKLKDMADEEDRKKTAESLAKDGYKIDVPIMVFHWDAYKTMKIRQEYGFTWVPSALQQNIQIAPGLISHGVAPYDPNAPPSGSIKVSVEAKDYPAFDKPAAPAPVEGPKSPVGAHSIGNLYLTTVGDTYPAGTLVNEPRGKFIKRVQAGPFGAWAYWEKI